MKILISYLQEDEKLKKCLDSLNKTAPQVEVVKLKANPKETACSEEVFMKWILENGPQDIMIWHPDMEAKEGWYEKVIEHYHKFDVLGCKLLYPNGLVQHFGGAIKRNGMGYHPHQYSLNIGLTEPQEVAYVTGPSMIIKKKVFEKIGLWDTQFTYFIDVDYCFRAREAGFKIGVVPAEIIHEEGADQLKKRTFEHTNELIDKNHAIFVAKHLNLLSNEI